MHPTLSVHCGKIQYGKCHYLALKSHDVDRRSPIAHDNMIRILGKQMNRIDCCITSLLRDNIDDKKFFRSQRKTYII